MKGYVYVLGNEAMPGLLKIGRTTQTPQARAKNLSAHSGVPSDFDVLFSLEVEDCVFVEREAHELLWYCRFNEQREFFSCPPEIAEEALWVAQEVLLNPDDPNKRRRWFYLTHERPYIAARTAEYAEAQTNE